MGTRLRRLLGAPASVGVALADGGTVRLRLLAPGESAVLSAVFDGMSDRSRRSRYLTATAQLSGRMCAALTGVDLTHHVAWVAEVNGRAVGIARFIRLAHDPRSAEFAAEVIDAHHGRGIGRALLDATATVATYRGIRCISATLDPRNKVSKALLARLGAQFRPGADGLLEAGGCLRLPVEPAVDRRAVLALLHEPRPRTLASRLRVAPGRLVDALPDWDALLGPRPGGGRSAGPTPWQLRGF